MSTNPFAAPATATGIQWADLKGRLLVVEPLAAENAIPTSFGEADAVRANVYAIDGAPESFEDVLVFPKVLASQLRPKIGEKVLGRLGQGQAKAGQSAPWMIQTATTEDIAAGVAWLETRKPAFSAPAATAPTAGRPPF